MILELGWEATQNNNTHNYVPNTVLDTEAK
jgi:hypothetical protein